MFLRSNFQNCWIPKLLGINTFSREEATLRKATKERLDCVGIDVPTIEVRFEHLNVDAEAYVVGIDVPTIEVRFEHP
ncbi:hypothetical protein FRX31_027854 [Thalictrum thalictroides]|uniref:Uncharacterized protein n=1 Tax=Thalictrum thalictroides TaxID=46969 RepID=A0A7J6VBV3_THATH|nr:hypothetical protein FRX31_027854 [Thalictrum thalictroides]